MDSDHRHPSRVPDPLQPEPEADEGEDEDEELDPLAASFARKHLRSMEDNQPERYKALMASPGRQEYLDAVGNQALDLYESIMNPVIAQTGPMKDVNEKVGRLEAARMRAESEVMREIVLVPDEETERAMRDGYQ